MEAFDSLTAGRKDIHDKHLALALGVTPPTVVGWRKLVEKTNPARGPNQKTREAIQSLEDSGVLWGLDAAVRQMRGTVEDLERALEVRRALRGLDAPNPPTSDDELVDYAQRTMRGARKPNEGDDPEKKSK